MYDPNKWWFYVSKTNCFCFLMILNCENLAKQLLLLDWYLSKLFLYDLSNTIFCPIDSALTKQRVASQIWTHNNKRLAYTLTTKKNKSLRCEKKASAFWHRFENPMITFKYHRYYVNIVKLLVFVIFFTPKCLRH